MAGDKISFNDVLREFCIEEEISPYGNGHINESYCVGNPHYLIQKINTSVFKNPDKLMENMVNVTNFLKEKIAANGGDPKRETLTIIKTRHGENYFKFDDTHVYRAFDFIEGTKTIENDKTPADLYEAGKGFGRFQKLLDDFPVDNLYEVIKDFHNTPKRMEAFKKAVAEDKMGRASLVAEEINYVLSNEDFAKVVVENIEAGKIPVRVTHNDTKINNILFDAKTGEAVAVIDLDTVMPGSMLYDFGDALRLGASTALEDETDLDKVHIDIESFKEFTRGYLEEMLDFLTPTEKELMHISARLMTFECGLRFLTDYLEGDTYFRIHRENHNLDRARNQFKLCKELAEREDELKSIIADLC